MTWGSRLAVRFGPQRVAQLAQALRAWREAGAPTALRLPWADAQGDASAQLAAEMEQLTERVARQQLALVRAERQQRELLAKVSHDLRTPLASMQGYLELLLLREGQLDPAEQRNYLQTAVRQSERLARLVHDLFELSRLEADDMRPACEDFVLAELAHDVLQSFGAEAQRRTVSLALDGCDGTPPLRVHADMGLVERVLRNLLENALRHTPAAGDVTVHLQRDGTRARIVVRDSGEGIPREQLDGLFDRYRRGERVGGSGGPQGHGGLGLAIARRIVRLHGGELSVHSERGQGTRIGFDLPLAAGGDTSQPRGSATA